MLFCGCARVGQPEPTAIAIRNAKIVTVSGAVIAKGTVVVRNGLIEAVGDNVPVPADALVIDGEGLTVYPGLVDALSTWGMPGAAPRRAVAAEGRGGAAPAAAAAPAAPPSRGPEDRPATTSWIKAADEIQPATAASKPARSAGFTTAVVFPTRGIFARAGIGDRSAPARRASDMVLVPSRGPIYFVVARAAEAAEAADFRAR